MHESKLRYEGENDSLEIMKLKLIKQKKLNYQYKLKQTK